MKKQTIHQLLTDIYYTVPKAEETVVSSHYENLTTNELHVLRSLAVGGYKDVEAVARALHINSYAVTGTLDTLVTKEYITREWDLTDKGTRALETYKDLIRQGIGEMVQSMSDDEVDTIIRGLGFLSGYIGHLTSPEH